MSDERTQAAVPPASAPHFMGGAVSGAAAGAKPMACHIGHISPSMRQSFVTVEVWNKHVRVKRQLHDIHRDEPKPIVAKRGKVDGLSPHAARRLRWAIENTPELMASGALFIGLTYPSVWPCDGRIVKRQLDTLGKRCRRLGAVFAWALEYQTRGAPHFHLLSRFPEDWDVMRVRQWVAESWFEIVNSGDEKHLHAGTSVEVVRTSETAGSYISNYVGKKDQKTVPEGVTFPGRMWGMVGCKPPKPEIIRFEEKNKEGVQLLRNLRRSASSSFAFRQRIRTLGKSERRWLAKWVGDGDREFRRALRDFKNTPITATVEPKNRKAWSPRDSGRDKGFSVRNAAKLARLLIEKADK